MANIMVVDDATFIRMTLKKILEAHGHVIIGEANDGDVAIERYKELNPDVVMLDITMPNMNGIEALKELKKINPNIKVVICSSMGQDLVIAEAIECGAKDFVVKPFKEEHIIAAIEKVLSR